MTFTLTRWPSHSNLPWSFWRCTRIPKMNCLDQRFHQSSLSLCDSKHIQYFTSCTRILKHNRPSNFIIQCTDKCTHTGVQLMLGSTNRHTGNGFRSKSAHSWHACRLKTSTPPCVRTGHRFFFLEQHHENTVSWQSYCCCCCCCCMLVRIGLNWSFWYCRTVHCCQINLA